MRNRWISLGFILLLAPMPSGFIFSSPLLADEDSAFKPHWDFQLGLTSSGTPGDHGGGGSSSDLAFTATDNFTESGDFISLEGLGGRQKLEGSFAKYGDLSVSGGLGLGFFLPSLSLTAQTGDEALLSTTAELNLGFQLFDDISIGVMLNGGFSSHQVPLSVLVSESIISLLPDPNVSIPDTPFRIDSKNWGGGLSFIWATSDIFTLSLSGQTTNENTDQLQNLSTMKKNEFDQTTVIPSSSIGCDWAFIKDFSLNVTLQRSEEIEPSGLSYSPSLSQFVYNEKAATLYFSGYSVGLTYSFQ